MGFRELRRFLTGDQIEETLRRLNAQAGQRRFVLVGGVAMAWYGSSRLTQDVDVASTEVPWADAIRTARRRLNIGGFAFLLEDVPVDWIVRSDDYADYYAEAIKRADDTGAGYGVLMPHDLVITKMIAGRDRDHEDAVWLLRRKGLVDLKIAEQIARRLGGRYMADELQALTREAAWRSAHDREEE